MKRYITIEVSSIAINTNSQIVITFMFSNGPVLRGASKYML